MKKLLLISVIAFIVFASQATSISAAVFDIWEGTGSGGANTCNVSGPCSFCDALKVVFNIVNSLVYIATILAVIIIIYGALRLVTAGGSEDHVKTGRDAITNAVIGLAIALSAWIIVNEVIHILSGNPNFPWSQVQCTNEVIRMRGGSDLPGGAGGPGDDFDNGGGTSTIF